MMGSYWSVFTKTFAALAATALLAAQTLKWDTPEDVRTSGTVLGFSLLMALIGGVIAVLWSIVGTPAVTPLGRAIRSAIQALLAAPIAGVVLDSTSDFADVSKMVIPTVAGVVIAFVLSLSMNVGQVPEAPKPVGSDVLGTGGVAPTM